MEMITCNFCDKIIEGHKITQVRYYYVQHMLAHHPQFIAVFNPEINKFITGAGDIVE